MPPKLELSGQGPPRPPGFGVKTTFMEPGNEGGSSSMVALSSLLGLVSVRPRVRQPEAVSDGERENSVERGFLKDGPYKKNSKGAMTAMLVPPQQPKIAIPSTKPIIQESPPSFAMPPFHHHNV